MKAGLLGALVAAAITSSSHALTLVKRQGVEPRVVGIPIERRTDKKIVVSPALRRRSKTISETLDNFEVSSDYNVLLDSLLTASIGWLALLCQCHYGYACSELPLSYRYRQQ